MAKKPKVQEKKGGYGRYLENSDLKVSPVAWIAMAIVIAAIVSILLFFAFPNNVSLAIISAVVISVLLIGFPIIIKERRDTQIEDAIPDVFQELATSLRAGATIEQALLDLTKIQVGPLIEELKIALNDMEAGFSFEESLENIMSRIDIVTLERIFRIVIDGRKAGGELADILDAVAEDSRKMSRIRRERQSKTLLYVIFIFAAGGVVAPIIFGFVTEIGTLVANIGSAVEVANPLNVPGTDINVFWLYLLIQSFISGIMLAVVRGIRIWKGVVFYSLSMMLLSTIIFEVSKFLASTMMPTTF